MSYRLIATRDGSDIWGSFIDGDAVDPQQLVDAARALTSYGADGSTVAVVIGAAKENWTGDHRDPAAVSHGRYGLELLDVP